MLTKPIMWDDSNGPERTRMYESPNIDKETVANSAFFHEVLTAIDTSITAEDVWDNFYKYTQKIGVCSLTYYHLSAAGARDFENYYLANRGKNSNVFAIHKVAIFDPEKSFLHKARGCDRPIIFDETTPPSLLNEVQSQLFRALHMNDNTCGVVIPTHASFGRTGCFVLETDNNNPPMKAIDIRQLQWMAQIAHQTYCRIRQRTRKTVKQLTAREKQILTWVARGKSNSVIADIVGISQHTVNGYLRSIYLKTGTSDRTTAALRGIGEILIDI